MRSQHLVSCKYGRFKTEFPPQTGCPASLTKGVSMKEVLFCVVLSLFIWNNHQFQTVLNDADSEISEMISSIETYVYKIKHVI